MPETLVESKPSSQDTSHWTQDISDWPSEMSTHITQCMRCMSLKDQLELRHQISPTLVGQMIDCFLTSVSSKNSSEPNETVSTSTLSTLQTSCRELGEQLIRF